MRRCARLAALLLATAMTRARAQVPVIASPDSVTADSIRTDSLRRLRDTLSTTDRLLAGQKDLQIVRQPVARCGAARLQVDGALHRFNRDSLDWITAEDLTDLLALVPGVFVHRADFLGGPNYADYLGRGAASVEYVLDCVPQVALDRDSVAYDPSVFPLGMLDEVDVETSPTSMRVYLFTRAHDRAAPRTKVEVAQGDRGVAHYFGSYEARHANGLGVSFGADYRSLNPKGPQGGGNSLPSGWLQLSLARSAHFGVSAQLISQSSDRDLLLDDAKVDTLLRAQHSSRLDVQLRAAWQQRSDGLGASLDVFAGATHQGLGTVVARTVDTLAGAAGDSLVTRVDSAVQSRSLSQFGVIGGWRTPTIGAQFAAWSYSKWTPLDSRLDVGWSPRADLSASVQLAGQLHDHDRKSSWAIGRLGLVLPFGFHVEGSFSDGSRVQAPSLAADTAQRFTDATLTAGYRSRPFTLETGYTSDHGWQPQAFSEFVAVSGFAPLPRTDWLTVHARFAPVGFLTLESVFQHPQHGILPDGTPPEHALSTITLRSRFLRNFRSGIFQLKLQAAVESWSPGVGGRDSSGAAIHLPGSTFLRSVIQLQLGPFIAYYDRVNLKAVRAGYVPGYEIQPLGSTYGFRWEFSN